VTRRSTRRGESVFYRRFLCPARIWALAIILAVCLWGICLVDFATPGLFDRAGNTKFQDFLQFPISARLIAKGHADQLYDDHILAQEIRATTGRDTHVYLQYFYGPQVAIPFISLSSLPFLAQAEIWAMVSVTIYFICIYVVWKRCPALKGYRALVFVSALAYPPFFHFLVRGQLSAIVLACIAAAYLALGDKRDFMAGAALGLLAFKPQFVVAIPLILLLARAWPIFAGLTVSAAAQLLLTSIYFGRPVMQAYLTRLLHSASNPASTELSFSRIQMHSLYSFWEILIPSRPVVWVLYLLCVVAAIVIAAKLWSSSAPLSVRFSALIVAVVLVNPHIYIYDLLALAPVFLILTDWSLQRPDDTVKKRVCILLYLAFLLPLFGPLAYWSHLQLSVPIYAALLWTLWRIQFSPPSPATDWRT
jgi:hypothetical protein